MGCQPDKKADAEASLEINGKEVPLNSFVSDFISQTLLGMVKSLQGVERIETIDLTVSVKQDS